MLALSGEQAAGMPVGVNYDRVGHPKINDEGQIAFAALMDDDFSSNGIWSNRSGTFAPIVLAGDAAPGTSNGLAFADLQLFGFNDSGQVAITATLRDSSGQAGGEGVWSEKDGNLRLVAHSGQPAPGAPNNELFRYLGVVSINAVGHTAFLAETNSGKLGVWLDGSRGLELVSISGKPTPGIAGGEFGRLWSPVIGSNNQVAFQGGATDGFLHAWVGTPDKLTYVGVPVRLDGAYYFDKSGTFGVAVTQNGFSSDSKFGSPDHLEIVARSGDRFTDEYGELHEIAEVSLPYFGRDGSLSMKLATRRVGDDMQTLEFGFWRKTPGGWNPIARIGDQAPGAAEGIVFTAFEWQVFNELGQVAFSARLSGGVTGVENGIWATDLSGQLRLIAKVGDSLEVAPGDVRMVRDLYFAGDALNNKGQLVFQANLDGKWGAFLSHAVAVPEPGAVTLMAMCFFSLLGRCKRGHRRPPLVAVPQLYCD